MLKTIFQLCSTLVQTKGVGSTSACESENTNFQWWLRCTVIPPEQPVAPCHPYMKDSLRGQRSILAPAKEGVQEILL